MSDATRNVGQTGTNTVGNVKKTGDDAVGNLSSTVTNAGGAIGRKDLPGVGRAVAKGELEFEVGVARQIR